MNNVIRIIFILLLIFIISGFVYHIININSKQLEKFQDQVVEINAMVPRPYPETQGEIIVFGNSKWLSYDVPNTRIIKGAYNYNEHDWFKGLPEEFVGFDAICQRPSDPLREMIIFKDNKWILWNFTNDNVEGGPFLITEHKWFSDIHSDFTYKIDAVILEPGRSDTHLIFFKNHQYLIWNFSEDRVETGPHSLGFGPKFSNLPNQFKLKITSAYSNPNNADEIYLFSGNKWINYNYKNSYVISQPSELLSDGVFKRMALRFVEVSDTPSKEFVAMDKSGKNHHASIYNANYVSIIPKLNSKNFDVNSMDMFKNGKSLKLNGKNSYIELQDLKELYKEGFSISMFFKISEYVQSDRQERILASCYGEMVWQVLINKSGFLEFRIKRQNDGLYSILQTTEKLSNKWYHVTVSQDNLYQRIYLNDSSYSKLNAIKFFPMSPNNILIGCGGVYPSLEGYFEGLIGEIRVYNRSLEKNELCKLNPFCAKVDEEIDIVQEPAIDIAQCVFKPKGLREIDCFKLCNNESSVNNCNTNQCLETCARCNDPDDCIWLQPPQLLKREQAPNPEDTSKCQFKPYGESLTQCKDICSGKDRNKWGGDKCSSRECSRICGECDDDYCKWIDREVNETPKSVPGKINLSGVAGNEEISLMWSIPSDGNSAILNYVIIYYETRSRDKTIRTIDYICRNSRCSYTIGDLKNNTLYTVTISAVNAIGMGTISNVLKLKPNNSTPGNIGDSTDDGLSSTEKEYLKTLVDKTGDDVEKLQDKETINELSRQITSLEKKSDDLLYSAAGTLDKDWLSILRGKTLDFNIKI